MTIDSGGQMPFVINVDRRTGFNGVTRAEAPASQEPSLYFAARLFYRRATCELFETAVYRRLDYSDLSFSTVEQAIAHLNYTGIAAYQAESRERPPDLKDQ